MRVGGGGGLVGGSPDSGHSDEGVRGEGVERLLRQQLTEEECRAVLDSTAASDPDDLETFARWVPVHVTIMWCSCDCQVALM